MSSGRWSTIQLAPWSAAGLLVGGRREHDVPGEAGDRIAGRVASGRARLGGEAADHADLHRDHALHVDRAAAPDVAVGDVGGERVVRPAVSRGRDHVDVREQEERVAAAAVAVEAGDDRAASRGRLEDLGRHARVAEQVGHEPGGPQLAVTRLRGRVDARDPDELAEVVDELVVGAPPVGGGDGVRRPDGAARGGRARDRAVGRRHGQPADPVNPSTNPMIPITNPPTTMTRTIARRRRR